MKLEDEVQQLIQIEAAKHECILLRNNSGALKDATGRVVRYGLGNVSEKYNSQMKSSDLIGITTVKITSDMVGKYVGIFTAIEVKREDWKYKGLPREAAQNNFLAWVRSSCGLGGFANGVEAFRKVIGK